MDLDLIRTLIRDAAWPGLVVLVAHAVLGEIFGHEPYVDPAMHFSGGMAAAFFFTRLPRVLRGWLGDPTPVTIALLGIGLTSTVAVLWEFGEFLADVALGTHIQRGIGNTMRDLMNGILGAAVFIVADAVVWRGRRATVPIA